MFNGTELGDGTLNEQKGDVITQPSSSGHEECSSVELLRWRESSLEKSTHRLRNLYFCQDGLAAWVDLWKVRNVIKIQLYSLSYLAFGLRPISIYYWVYKEKVTSLTLAKHWKDDRLFLKFLETEAASRWVCSTYNTAKFLLSFHRVLWKFLWKLLKPALSHQLIASTGSFSF